MASRVGAPASSFVHSRTFPWAEPNNTPSRWVVFSDIHVSHGTLAVCEEVLARTHAEARARGAGILFLGDFWHVRGSLRVEQLNRVLQSLRLWGDTPCIMIPGNHDQVDVEGTTHALTPLSFALEHCKIISQSEIFLGALWLPYRRDLQQLQDSIADAFSVDASQHPATPRPRAIFCHADVAGASMSAGTMMHETPPLVHTHRRTCSYTQTRARAPTPTPTPIHTHTLAGSPAGSLARARAHVYARNPPSSPLTSVRVHSCALQVLWHGVGWSPTCFPRGYLCTADTTTHLKPSPATADP